MTKNLIDWNVGNWYFRIILDTTELGLFRLQILDNLILNKEPKEFMTHILSFHILVLIMDLVYTNISDYEIPCM